MDYAVFIFGLSFIWIMVVGMILSRWDRIPSLSWMLFAIFALFFGINEWLGLILRLGDPWQGGYVLRIGVKALGAVFLLEFSRRYFWRSGRKIPRWWILPLLALVGVMGSGGLIWFEIGVGAFLYLPSGLLVAWIFLVEAKKVSASQGFWLRLISASLLVFLLTEFIVPISGYLAGFIAEMDAFRNESVPVRIFRSLYLLFWISALIFLLKEKMSEVQGQRAAVIPYWPAILLLGFLAGGWLLTCEAGRQQGQAEREQLLLQAQSYAARIHPVKAEKVNEPASLSASRLDRLEAQLSHLIANTPGALGAGIEQIKGRQVYPIVQVQAAELEGWEKMIAAASTRFLSFAAPEQIRTIVFDPLPGQERPLAFAFVPYTDPQTGQVAGMFHLVVDGKGWLTRVADSRLVLICMLMPLMLVILLGSVEFAVRHAPLTRPRKNRKYAEAVYVILMGFLLTAVAVHFSYQDEQANHQEQFTLAASRQIDAFTRKLDSLREHIDGLQNFYLSSATVTREEFVSYATPLLSNVHGIQAVEWIPYVPASELEAYQEAVRAQGFEDFFVFELDGLPKPVTAREAYYPVDFIVPFQENEAAFGFDLGSEPTRLSALLNAASSGFSQATGPVSLVQDTKQQVGFLVMHPIQAPVSADRDGSAPDLQGFIVMVMRAQELMNAALEGLYTSDKEQVDLFFLDAGEQEDPLIMASAILDSDGPASYRELLGEETTPYQVVKPIFYFGRPYLLAVKESQRTFSGQPAIRTWMFAGLGGVLSLAIGLLIFVLQSARERAENQVILRTTELRASEERFRSMFEKNNAVMLLIDLVERTILQANQSAANFYGYDVKALAGMKMSRITGEHPKDCILNQGLTDLEAVRFFAGRHLLASGEIREVEVSLTQIMLDGRHVLFSIIQDVTEREKARSELVIRNDFLTSLLDTIPSPVFYKDRQGVYLGCNKAFEDYLGLTREQIIGKTAFDIAPAEIAIEYEIKDRELFANPGRQTYEWKIRSRSGKMRSVIFNKATYRDANGEVIGLIGTILDITARKRMEDYEREQRHQAEALRDAAEILSQSLDYEEILQKVLESAASVLPHDAIHFLLMDGRDPNRISRLVRSKLSKFSSEEVDGFMGLDYHKIKGLAWMAENQRPLLIPYTKESPFWTDFKKLDKIQSFIGAPIFFKDRLAGFLNLGSFQPGFYNTGQIKLLEQFSAQIAMTMENARLYAEVQRLSIHDELTNLLNRRGLLEYGERLVERACVFEKPLSVLFIDIDHFRDFNNLYSYAVGDLVLQQLAQVMQTSTREADLLARYGGEEFVILLNNTPMQSAKWTAERLRRRMENCRVETEWGELSVTVSVGIAEQNSFAANGKEGNENYLDMLESLVSCAGDALHKAKAAGRNRVAVHDCSS